MTKSNINFISSDLVFTQYLYVKQEVRISLLVSILNKSDDAIFWAYELYYSGFKQELLDLIWKIYYDFFATLNPAYEPYLLKKYKEIMSDENVSQNCNISSIIQDLLFRPFNTDVFMLRNICATFEIETKYRHDTEKINNNDDARKNLTQWVENSDFRSIAQWVLNENNGVISVVDIYELCINIFEQSSLKTKLTKEFANAIKLNIDVNVILLAKIIQLFSKKAQLKKGRSVYINVEAEDIIPYEPIIGSDEIKHYTILKKAYMCGIDDLKHLSLFKLTRNKYNLKELYCGHWEYYASFSPLWSQRLTQFGAYVDHTLKKVIFNEETDDLIEEFYRLYGLEPDEQKKEIQNKSIGSIEKKYNWKWFNSQYKKNGLIDIYDEELEEFDVDGLYY